MAAGRIDPDVGRRLLANPRLLPLGVVAIWAGLPLPLVRFLRDPLYRMLVLRHAWRAVVDESYQLALAERFIMHRIQEWESTERLTPQESEVLRQTVASLSAQEYV
jgi:hypothetical protein